MSQLKHANKILIKFVETEKRENSSFLFENRQFANFNYFWMKWLAENELFPSKTFFNAISHQLKWIFLEFQPRNSILRAASKFSQAYHKAYFDECVEEILSHYPDKRFTPKEVYQLEEMEKIRNQLRQLGGNYKKRTFLESWLPDLLGPSKRGRPPKKRS